MAETTKIKTRIQLKNDTEANWSKATNFIPKKGELIIYNPASGSTGYKFKIGKDDTTKINNLSFAVFDATCLPASGVTAGSYGQASAGTLAHGGSFKIPYITVDNKGRVTAASTINMTLPASENTDYRVKIDAVSPSASTDYYPTFYSSTSASNATLSTNSHLRLRLLNGTTNTEGVTTFILGNNIAEGTINNYTGSIALYSAKTGLHLINTTDTTTTITHTLPATSGTLLNSGTTSFTKSATEGTILGTLKINNTSQTIQAPIPSALIQTLTSNKGVDFNEYLSGRITISLSSATNTNGPSLSAGGAMTVWNIPIIYHATAIIDGTRAWEHLVQVAMGAYGDIAFRNIESRSTAGQYFYRPWHYIPNLENAISAGNSTTPVYISNHQFQTGISYAKAIKSITRSGTTFTYTCIDGSTGTFTQQDNNTTYTAGNGLSLSGNKFSVSYSTTVSALGTASAGTSVTVARGDHTHAMPALTSCTGTLSVAKGGTGATSRVVAIENLGGYSLADKGIKIADKTDLNTLTAYNYYCNGAEHAATLINGPVTNSGFLLRAQIGYGGSNYSHQFAYPADGNIYNRFKSSNDTWTSWRKIIHDKNYTNYTVTKTGDGASGTWGISITGNANTASALQSAKTISLTGDVTGSTTFNGSTNASITTNVKDDSHTHSFSTIIRGNGNWADAVSPIDYGLINTIRACRTAFTPANAIKVEYSTDGSTWTDYGLSNGEKRKLFLSKANGASQVNLGKTGEAAVNKAVRITIEPIDRYAFVDTFYCWFCSQGHTCVCTIEASTKRAQDTFTVIKENIPIDGWTGPNEITFQELRYGGFSTQVDNKYKIRFTFKITKVNSNTTYLSILPYVTDLRLYGRVIGIRANNMMDIDHIYDWDMDQNVTFPAKITATSFEGNATTATTLANSHTINGTSFNGSANITTANWGTSRTLTIGSTGKSVNGSGNVSWSLAEIGAAPASHTHDYFPNTGGILKGHLYIQPPGTGVEGGEIQLWAPKDQTDLSGIILDNYNGMFRIFGAPSADGTIPGREGIAFDIVSKRITGGFVCDGNLPLTGGQLTGNLYIKDGLESQIQLQSDTCTLYMFNNKTGGNRGIFDTLKGQILTITASNETGLYADDLHIQRKLEINGSIVDRGSPTGQMLVLNCGQPGSDGVSDRTAPGIGFHIANHGWGSLVFHSNMFRFCNSDFTGYVPVVASEFQGGGYWLTNLNASNIGNGTLAIAYGGTGANSKAGARTNLGITSGTALPSPAGYAAGDIFILY